MEAWGVKLAGLPGNLVDLIGFSFFGAGCGWLGTAGLAPGLWAALLGWSFVRFVSIVPWV